MKIEFTVTSSILFYQRATLESKDTQTYFGNTWVYDEGSYVISLIGSWVHPPTIKSNGGGNQNGDNGCWSRFDKNIDSHPIGDWMHYFWVDTDIYKFGIKNPKYKLYDSIVNRAISLTRDLNIERIINEI